MINAKTTVSRLKCRLGHRDQAEGGDAKRPSSSRWRAFAVVLLFGLTSLIFIEFAPLRGATVGAVDITTRLTSPYLEDQSSFVPARNPLQSDQTDGVAQSAVFWRGIQRGEILAWDNHLGTGVPLGSVAHTRVWSPLFLPGIVVPPEVLSSYAAWLTLWVAQLGAWALARQLGVGQIGAILSGVAYGFSGPVAAMLLRIHEVAFAPWVLLGVHRIMNRGPVRLSAFAFLTLAMAATWAGGFPAAAVFTVYAAAAVALGQALLMAHEEIRTSAQRLARPLASLVAGTLLVSPLLLPTYEFLAASGATDRSFGSDHAAGFALFGTSLSGRILGTYPERDWWWPDPGYSDTYEASATIGVVVLLLLALSAISARVRPARKPTSVIARVYMPLGLVVFFGTFIGGPVLAALQQLPFIDSNAFGRSRFLLSLVIALAAGNALDGFLHPREDTGRPDPVFRVLSGITVLAAVVSAGLVLSRAAESGFVDRALDGLIVPAICLAVAAAIVVAMGGMAKRGSVRHVGALVLVGLLTVELQWGAWGFTPVVEQEEGFYPHHRVIDLMGPDAASGFWRFAGTDINVIRPNSASWLEIADVRTASPSYRGYRELMQAIDPGVFERSRLRTWFTPELNPSSPGLDRASVKYLVAPGTQGVLDAHPADQVALVDGIVTVPPGMTPLRGLRVRFDSERCLEGFVVVYLENAVVSRQPLWRIGYRPLENPVDIPLPDLGDETALNLAVEGCSADLPSHVNLLRADPDSQLKAISSVGAVVYERLGARPRFELATSVEGIADKTARLSRVTSSNDTNTVVLSTDHPRLTLGGGTVALISDTGDHLSVEVQSKGPGYLIVRDANAPGWHAVIDETPAEIIDADHAFRAVKVPDGRSIVTMYYAPGSRTLGWWLTGTVVVLCLGAIVWNWLRTRKIE